MSKQPMTPFEAIGGEQCIAILVDTFYSYVSKHPDLSPIFGRFNRNRQEAEAILTQYLGGPNLYTEEHGHPMLRARHLPFEITPKRAEAWLSCMEQAMDDTGVHGHIREFVLNVQH